MSGGSSVAVLCEVAGQTGRLIAAGNGSLFGNLNMGVTLSATMLGKSQIIVQDRTTSIAGLNIASHGEAYTLDYVGSEGGFVVNSTVPSTTASGATHFKSGISSVIVTSALSNAPTAFYQSSAVTGVASTNGTVAQGQLCGISGQAVIIAGTDGQGSGIAGGIVNSGTAVSTVATALSKYALELVSSGTQNSTAFVYCHGQAGAGGSPAARPCVHGVLVDDASISGGNAFGVIFGNTPTYKWGISAAGKQVVGGANLAAPAAGGGPFTATDASNITVVVNSLTLVAQNISAPITVTTTAVTASSRIWAQVIAYGFGAGGAAPGGAAMAAGCPVVCMPGTIVAGTSFTFQIANVGTGALSGNITIAFKIEN